MESHASVTAEASSSVRRKASENELLAGGASALNRRALPPGASYGKLPEPDRLSRSYSDDKLAKIGASVGAGSPLAAVPERSNSVSTNVTAPPAGPAAPDAANQEQMIDSIAAAAPPVLPRSLSSPTKGNLASITTTDAPPFAMEGPYPALSSPSKGKMRESDSASLVDDPFRIAQRAALPPLDMAGIGRNSIVKAAPSPTSLMGPAPLTGTNSAAPSPIAPSPTAFALNNASAPAPTPAYGAPPSPLPPHLVPQPEICIECMMRDRDMADVDVTGDGVWDRDSDQDFYDALRWDIEDASASEESASLGLGARSRRRGSRDAGSRESSTFGAAASRASLLSPSNRKKIGRGQPLTESGLKLWTSMNPPASSHRWRTLQTFLATQAHLIELEKQAREIAIAEKMNREALQAADTNTLHHSLTKTRSRQMLPNGLMVETIDVAKDEKEGRARAKSRSSRASMERPPSSILPPVAATYREQPPVQPWLSTQARRFSSPAMKDASPSTSPVKGSGAPSVRSLGMGKFARSSTDLRSCTSPRSLSPSRQSLMVDDAKRNSMWSRFMQSSHSVLSFAPSGGSMLDMHLGLSIDKHNHVPPYDTYSGYPSMSDPAVARHSEERERVAKAEVKKKGIKAFIGKLKLRGDSKKKRGGVSASAPATPQLALEFDDGDLPPPPSLSALANEPRYHQRNYSNSSIDSMQPFTPPPSQPRALSTPLMPTSSNVDYFKNGDRRSILTAASFNSSRSKQQQPPHQVYGMPPTTVNSLQPATARTSIQRMTDGSSGEPSPPQQRSYTRPPSPPGLQSNAVEEIQTSPVAASNRPIRKEKSLPSLPSEVQGQHDSDEQLERDRAWANLQARGTARPRNGGESPYAGTNGLSTYGYAYPNRSTTSFRTPSLSPAASRDFADESAADGQFGGGKRSKARSKIFSLDFASLVKGGGRNKGRHDKANEQRDRERQDQNEYLHDRQLHYYDRQQEHRQPYLNTRHSQSWADGLDRRDPYYADAELAFDPNDTAVSPAAMSGIQRDHGLVSIRF